MHSNWPYDSPKAIFSGSAKWGYKVKHDSFHGGGSHYIDLESDYFHSKLDAYCFNSFWNNLTLLSPLRSVWPWMKVKVNIHTWSFPMSESPCQIWWWFKIVSEDSLLRDRHTHTDLRSSNLMFFKVRLWKQKDNTFYISQLQPTIHNKSRSVLTWVFFFITMMSPSCVSNSPWSAVQRT